jgi:alpha-L-fucosidase
VLVAEYPRRPEMETGLIFKNIEGGYSLTPDKRLSSEGAFNLSGPDRYGTIPRKAAIQSESTMKWRLFIDQPGKYRLEASYSCQGDPAGGALKLSCGKQRLEHDLLASGVTVAEPNSNWHVPRYRAHTIGQLDFVQGGYYELELQLSPPPAGKLAFQWLWLKAVD